MSFLHSQNDGDNPFTSQNHALVEPLRPSIPPSVQASEIISAYKTNMNQTTGQAIPQNTNKQVIRVTSNPNKNPQIPTTTSSSGFSAKKSSSISKPQTNTPAFRYRPRTLNTTTSGDKNIHHAKVTNASSSKPTVTKHEPVYATVGSVNANQRLVKNLKSANV